MADKQKKKPGKPSPFQGKRGELLLNTFYPRYADASKHGKTHHIWSQIFVEYWVAFPWCLPLTKDPDANNSTDYSERPVNAEEEKLKEKIMKDTEAVSHARRGPVKRLKSSPAFSKSNAG
jgi:hypothetical protein